MTLEDRFNSLADTLFQDRKKYPKGAVTSTRGRMDSTKKDDVLRSPFWMPAPTPTSTTQNSWTYSNDYNQNTSPAPGGGRQAGNAGVSHFSMTATNPFSGDATVNIYGLVDDSISVNGVEESLQGWSWFGTIFDASQLNPYPNAETAIYTGAHSIDYTFTVPGAETLVIDEINNFDAGASLSITVTFTAKTQDIMGEFQRKY
jgi:hypothetical protein